MRRFESCHPSHLSSLIMKMLASPPYPFPIDTVLKDIVGGLSNCPSAVIIAPPGSGKSTRVAPALLDGEWARGRQIWLGQPRRLAVRTLAHHLAQLSGKPVGDLIGYQMRDDSKLSAASRIVVMTMGVLRRRILSDPGLDAVAAVVFDEFHERALDMDLCFALARDVQANLRSDLRLVIMSATLDKKAILPRIPDFSVFEAEGKAFPVETVYLPGVPNQPLSALVARGVQNALDNAKRDILCFLPGVRDIAAAERLLRERYDGRGLSVVPLYGALGLKAQKAAISPADNRERRVILATDIAETSLTLPNVDAVVDAGLRRAPTLDASLGLTQLKTTQASLASVDQRRGRAGRVGPGYCVRLWAQQEMLARPSADKPEILTQDLSDLVLACADWGVTNLNELDWVDAPLPSKIKRTQKELEALGFLNTLGTINKAGRAAAQLPLPTDLSAFLLRYVGSADAERAALLCALMAQDQRQTKSEITDLEQALSWTDKSEDRAATQIRKRARQWLTQLSGKRLQGVDAPLPLGVALALCRPNLVAQARPGQNGAFKLASGRGAFVDPLSPLAKVNYLVVGDAILAGSDVRILSGWPLSREDVFDGLAQLLEARETIAFSNGKAERHIKSVLGEIVLETQRETLSPGPMLAEALLQQIQRDGLDRLPWPNSFMAIQARAAFARRFKPDIADISFSHLMENADLWLMPLLEQVPSLTSIEPRSLEKAALGLLDHQHRLTVDRLAPPRFKLPSGHTVVIEYSSDGTASVSAKLQAFFGLARHPTLADGKVALTLDLLSPAGRPLQKTQDLPGFWTGSYAEVRKEMRGRYPKHPWPEDPLAATPSMRVKKRM